MKGGLLEVSLERICKYKKDCTNLENCSTLTTKHLLTRVVLLKLLELFTQTKLDKGSSCNLHLKSKFKLF